MKFPNTVSRNTFKAYVNVKHSKEKSTIHLNAINLDWDANNIDSLRIMCIKSIAEHWQEYPIFSDIPNVEDRNYLLDIVDTQIPIGILASHIAEDVFWRRCFTDKWTNFHPSVVDKPWITIFMEKYFSEIIERLKPGQYNEEEMQNILDVCAPHLVTLRTNELQPALDDENNHIPFDFILSNLPQLKYIDLTFDLKSIGQNFYLHCSSISRNDIQSLASGIKKCYELVGFRIHCNKLEPYMLQLLAHALDKGSTDIENLTFSNCGCGDMGLVAFLDILNHESFPNLKCLVLTNNNFTQEGIIELAEVIKTRNIQTLDLRMNPIGCDGAAAIFGIMLQGTPIQHLNLAGCSITDEIEPLLILFLETNRIVRRLNLSSNNLGVDLGERIARTIDVARQLQEFDLRNTNISGNDKWIIDSVILENRDKCYY
ncbi:dynein regulatory complex subunit 5 [Bradysia coprophila]|uniref:dynein regulatory complex subunit 5 n=1 Tax=Bradysia coprophila TaxID=38358 RepID=UPI00187D8BBF|nr:dynein regulatory complex subunit 5 [Bradysia coprophila]